ncbi:putative FAD dependent oxidoreductase, FAD/NAD(P)-binding domain superfamily [Helianthus annuus]|uniref:FAD dependent oxidoreductase, FAD/NAD(P)-binding domain superfamily n=1 Tax=Helianthus annuus TaxID=4232 RepID=A0A251TJ42_HELAN|nr:probable sarcosine oxidase [Helianthus annuus]KAF5785109.1 putative FAD dependent oxidoreductase, FAD/NAD(P)-binding domain superfamily [Helianthus annuus]KAJ0520309.1 putative FAD dependent oxidoreductase, FAD/NAD(P)-binding domain superfamily [Helianthus annuus]KAJ0528830.1 putative FAD dependent oxidoreductase, FAD/NAD(P)-binding domain superfamily [Helianthus annuus]KAJ0695743.1 putative FAD dependent oxidoreductase, FAD/NAD(P)-binding domain superfamily [Helianthus annuus]
MNQFDIIIIGAGVMGSSAAYQAAKSGHKTLLLEQFDFLHYRGSSHGESRTIRATYPEPYYTQMVIESEKLWKETELEIGYKVYFKTQQLDLGPKESSSLVAVIDNCEKQLNRYRILDREQANECFSVEIPDDWIAVVTELGGVLKPTKAVAMFQTLAIKHGAVLKDKMEIVDVETDEDRGGVLVSSRLGEKFRGKKCVITAGAWVSKLVQKVSNGRVILPIQPIETTVFYWKIKQGKEIDFTIGAGFPSFASCGEPYIYGTPALEFPDLIKIAIHGGRGCDPDKRTWGAAVGGAEGTAKLVGYLKEWIKSRFGDRINWEDGPVMTQSCLYSITPDEDYIIDFLGGEFNEDVVVAGGFSGHGFKMAPVVGQILVDLAIGGTTAAAQRAEEIKHFKVGRFEGNPGGNVKHFGDQVRLR